MTTTGALPADALVLSAEKTRRDYRLSLEIVVAGAVAFVGGLLAEYLVFSAGIAPPPIPEQLLLSTLAGIGSTMILVGAIFAGINHHLLRAGRPLPPS